MAFQFLCPQGHLLVGDEAHMGMTTRCPHCGMTFIIPSVQVAPQPQVPQPVEPVVDAYSQPYVPDPEISHHFEEEHEVEPEPASTGLLEELGGGEAGGLLESAAASVVHIPCPNGHELETPLEMIGQEVLCPHCGAQFRLRNEDSTEYRHAREIIERRQAKLWFNWAIAAAVVVGIGLLTMLIYIIGS